MASPNATFTLANRPAGYDQTQKRFTLSGSLGLASPYTITTGIPIDFTAVFDSSGNKLVIPPTYTGANGSGQAVPLTMSGGAAGYTFLYDATNKSVRIWNGTTEVATGAVPAALLTVAIAINVAGTAYAANDTFSVAGQPGMVGKVLTVSSGVPATIQITTQGAAVTASAAATTNIVGTGSGLTVDVTVAAAGIPATFTFLRG